MPKLTPASIVDTLNKLLELSPTSINNVMSWRTYCDYTLKQAGMIRPHLGGLTEDIPTFGVIEIINSCIPGKRVDIEKDRKGNIVKFVLSSL